MLYKEQFKPFSADLVYAGKPSAALPINSCRSGKLCRKNNVYQAYLPLLKKNQGGGDKWMPTA